MEDIKLEYDIDDVLKITGHIERTISLEEKIAGISDDGERSRIIHRHIQEITVENRETEYEFGIGKERRRPVSSPSSSIAAKNSIIIICLVQGEAV